MIWDVRTGGLVAQWQAISGPISTLRFTPDGSLLLVATSDARLTALHLDLTSALSISLPGCAPQYIFCYMLLWLIEKDRQGAAHCYRWAKGSNRRRRWYSTRVES